MSGAGEGPPAADDEELAHAAADSSTTASDRDLYERTGADFTWLFRRGEGVRELETESIMARAPR
jgi:hypothetical protein